MDNVDRTESLWKASQKRGFFHAGFATEEIR